MSCFTTLNKFDAEGTPIKYDNYETEAEAQVRVSELHGMGLTDAFYIDADASAVNDNRCFQSCQHWIADLVAKTVTLDQVSFDAEIREERMKILRSERDNLLVESDNHVNPDQWASMNDSAQNNWASYRQALRDLPATTDPANPTWPIAPSRED